MEANDLERSVCTGATCGLVFDGIDRECPDCGARALPQTRIRLYGWLLIACALVVLGVMGSVFWFVGPILLAPGQEAGGTRFDGTREQLLFMLAVFAMVIAVGLATLIAGITQAIFGRLQRGAISILMVIAFALFAIGWMVRRGAFF